MCMLALMLNLLQLRLPQWTRQGPNVRGAHESLLNTHAPHVQVPKFPKYMQVGRIRHALTPHVNHIQVPTQVVHLLRAAAMEVQSRALTCQSEPRLGTVEASNVPGHARRLQKVRRKTQMLTYVMTNTSQETRCLVLCHSMGALCRQRFLSGPSGTITKLTF